MFLRPYFVWASALYYKTLAYLLSKDIKRDLFVVPVSGGAPRQITFDGADIRSLAWSADGQMIYFVSFRGSNQPGIWRVPAGGGTPGIVSTGGKDILNIAASSDGKTLAFVENLANINIWRSQNNRDPRKFISSPGSEFSPHFSSDGSRIVFISNRTGEYEVWTADAEGKNLRQITDFRLSAGSPRFSPDGSHITFSLSDDGENSHIFIISAEGGTPRRVTSGTSDDEVPQWSADGKWIFFISNRTGKPTIWKIPSDGTGEAVQIKKEEVVFATPSPDDKTIFFRKSVNAADMWRIPAEGSTEEIVPEFAAAGFLGTWERTGADIYFLTRNFDQSYKVKFYDFAAGQIKDAPGDYKIPSNILSTDIATDGNVFLYTVQDQGSRLMLAELP